MKEFLKKELYSFRARWLLLAVPTGLVCGAVGTAFHLAVEHVTEWRAEHIWLLWLLPGAEVILEDCIEKNPNRKTRYDLIVVKKNKTWVNIDSQAPNKVVKEWLMKQGYDCIKPEYTYGNSRMDFYMEKGKQKYLMEVKGCTLEIDGVGYFPDAPTERGVKHLRELAAACGQGYKCLIAFVIQMEGVSEVRPNTATHPEFGAALHEAKAAGVEVLFLKCHVGMDRLEIIGEDASRAIAIL